MEKRPYHLSYFQAKYGLARNSIIWICEHSIDPPIEFYRPMSADDVKERTKRYLRAPRLIKPSEGERLDKFLAQRRGGDRGSN